MLQTLKLHLSSIAINISRFTHAVMSGDSVSNTSAMYAVVDFSKKKKNKKVFPPEEVQESDSGIPLYAVVEKTKSSIASPKKILEHAHDFIDTSKNEIFMYEEPVP